MTPAAKRIALAHLMSHHEMSDRRACKAIAFCRMTIRYETRRCDDHDLRERMETLAHERRRFGYPATIADYESIGTASGQTAKAEVMAVGPSGDEDSKTLNRRGDKAYRVGWQAERTQAKALRTSLDCADAAKAESARQLCQTACKSYQVPGGNSV